MSTITTATLSSLRPAVGDPEGRLGKACTIYLRIANVNIDSGTHLGCYTEQFELPMICPVSGLGHRSARKYRICHTEWVIRPDFRDTTIAKQGADSSERAADVVGTWNLESWLQAVTFQAVRYDASHCYISNFVAR